MHIQPSTCKAKRLANQELIKRKERENACKLMRSHAEHEEANNFSQRDHNQRLAQTKKNPPNKPSVHNQKGTRQQTGQRPTWREK
jgi:hypothetical protein